MKIFIIESEGEMVGYHCSRRSLEGRGFEGDLKGQYVKRFFREIIDHLRGNQVKYNKFLEEVEEYNRLLNDSYFLSGQPIDVEFFEYELPSYDEREEEYEQMSGILENLGISLIFVFRHHPLGDYGDYCYEVYFKNDKYTHAHDDQEILADVYIYFTDENSPILVPYNLD
jgi:hypothetical protein